MLVAQSVLCCLLAGLAASGWQHWRVDAAAAAVAPESDGPQTCSVSFDPSKVVKASDAKCQLEKDANGVYPNVPLLSAVHCLNDGSHLCKAISGRFEFGFNSKTGRLLDKPPGAPAPAAGPDGFHARMPVAYTARGNVLYFDRALKWAAEFADSTSGKPVYNLLNSSSFNWCAHALANNWPYKSAIAHHDKRHVIYFFNRQTCIHDTSSGKSWFHNTRFQGRSKQLIDLDLNPTLFAMQDSEANGEIRLVKHKRRRWLEVRWTVEASSAGPKLKIEPNEASPCRLCNRKPLIPRQAYANSSDLCVTDYYLSRESYPDGEINEVCGIDQPEMVEDTTSADGHSTYDVTLHNLRLAKGLMAKFLSMFPTGEPSDGETFGAAITTYIAGTFWKAEEGSESRERRLITMYVQHGAGEPSNKLSLHKGTLGRRGSWEEEAILETIEAPEMNYVDDMAYLHACQSVLIIFGPLYTEMRAERVNLREPAPIGPLSALGVYEPVNAFFEYRGTHLFFYVRSNYIVHTQYECGKSGALARATKRGAYMERFGNSLNADSFPRNFFMVDREQPSGYAHSEEQFFKNLNVYKGNHAPDAPDPAGINSADNPDGADEAGLPAWAWLLLVVVLLVIIALAIAGYLKYSKLARRHGPAHHAPSRQAHSNLNTLTNRSALTEAGGGGSGSLLATPTNRSALGERSFSNKQGKPSTGVSRVRTPGRSGVMARGETSGRSHSAASRSSSAGKTRASLAGSSHPSGASHTASRSTSSRRPGVALSKK